MDRLFLEMALEEAKKAMKENTYPVGAIIVGRNNEILGKGRNRVHTQDDASAHAEIDAIRAAGKKLIHAKENRLPITLYTTLEPSEPFEDLAVKQRELMLEWAENPNNIHNKVLGGGR
ncbi:nucleoside deaminase [Bacillus pseudomycoides]|uniref:nucleoside deaminase n=1 Tax=Bacillus pseudomycoides TaxID=64104 RepID=UPI00352B81A3